MDLTFIEKLNKFKNDGQSFLKMSRKIRINPLMAEYYLALGEEYEDLLKTRGGKTVSFFFQMQKRSNRILRCGRFVDTLRFRELGIHEVKKVKLCYDKFCGNCQKQLANARERKYKPLLDLLSKYFDLYHITYTVPNPTAMFLPKTVEDMIHSFSQMMVYISGNKKIRGINFQNFGYVGCLRSLEITHNESNDTYHPHFHCIFAFKKGLNLDQPKVFINSFSYSNGRLTSKFSAFEVFIQKLWFLCYTGERVTMKAIEGLESGYSCKVNRADGNYHQIFKYAIKGLLDDKRAEMQRSKGIVNRNLSYEEFKTLFFALEGRRTMQGYGCFNKLKFDESVMNQSDFTDDELKEIVRELRRMNTEEENVSEKLGSVIENIVKKHEVYFSKKCIRDNLDSLKTDD